jgi:hypothetical protein
LGHIAVENLAPFVLDNKEAIQHAEGHGRHGKEIHSGEDFTVILQKSQPLPLGVPAATNAAQIAGYSPLRDDEAKLLQFGMDLGSAPIGIFAPAARSSPAVPA